MQWGSKTARRALLKEYPTFLFHFYVTLLEWEIAMRLFLYFSALQIETVVWGTQFVFVVWQQCICCKIWSFWLCETRIFHTNVLFMYLFIYSCTHLPRVKHSICKTWNSALSVLFIIIITMTYNNQIWCLFYFQRLTQYKLLNVMHNKIIRPGTEGSGYGRNYWFVFISFF